MKPKILVAIGTRPEAIKMAPVILKLKETGIVDVSVLATAQHRALLDQVLNFFEITPDEDLDIMKPSQGLGELTARILQAVDPILDNMKPDCVLVQGDTTTVLSVALAAFYKGVPIGHIEAGLRTGDITNPFPEELNRVLTSKIARWHFAPTQSAEQNLLFEHVEKSSIYVTGNTVIDALKIASSKTQSHSIGKRRQVLITSHRRENFGAPLKRVLEGLLKLATEFNDVDFIFPVHPNPNVKIPVFDVLGHIKNVQLIAPMEYPEFVQVMSSSHFIISDSGGVQEEAPALGKPVLVLRDETERPEAVLAGVVKLVGTDSELIYQEAKRLLVDSDYYASMAKGVSPYGDGLASDRIAQILISELT